MATTTKTSTRGKGAATAAPASAPAPATVSTEVKKVSATKAKTVAAKRAKPQFELTDSVLIRNGFHGPLIIELPKSGYTIKLQEFGDEDYVEIADLRTLRNSHPKFFKKNWILFDDPDVIDYLHVNEYYKNVLTNEEIEELFDLPEEVMTKELRKLSDGQRSTAMYAAMEKIGDGALDSIGKIKALEDIFGCKLMEDME